MTAVLVTVVTVPENVPQEPADHPVLFLRALGVSTHVIEVLRLGPGMSIDVQDLSVRGSLADLGIAERRLSVLQAIAAENIWCRHDSFMPGAGFFLR